MLYHKNENDAKQMAARLRISARRAVYSNWAALVGHKGGSLDQPDQL